MPRKLSDIGSSSSKMDLGANPSATDAPNITSVGAPGAEEITEEENTPVTEEVEVSEEEAVDLAEEALSQYETTPQSLWKEELKELGVTTQEAAGIFDTVMSTGKYEESYRVGKTIVRIRTRTTVDADRTIEILQDQRPESPAVYSHLVSRVNLAASLIQYGDNKFPFTDPGEDNRELLDAEWRERYRFCAALPAPAFYALSQVLQKFDEKVALSCDARSLENF